MKKQFSMRYIFLFITALALNTLYLKGQEKVVDVNTIKSWTSVSREAFISNNGKFLTYGINHNDGKRILVVKSVNGTWEKQFSNSSADQAQFTSDCRFIVFKVGKDSLAIQTLGQNEIFYLNSVSKWDLVKAGENEKLAFISPRDGNQHQLHLLDIRSGNKETYNNVNDFTKNNPGNSLLIHSGDDGLSWMDLQNGKIQLINRGKALSNITLDPTGRKVAYLLKKNILKPELWIYESAIGRKRKLSDNIPAYKDSVIISSIEKFSSNGRSVYVTLKAPFKPQSSVQNVGITIWGTKDKVDPVFQFTKDLPKTKPAKVYSGIVFVDSSKFMRLDQGDTTTVRPDALNSDWIIRAVERKNSVTGSWCELISGNTGSRIILDRINPKIGTFMSVAPSGRYLVYFDPILKHHCSYDVLDHVTRQISEGINNNWIPPLDHDSAYAGVPNYSGWLVTGKEERVLVSDGYDLWWLDAKGKKLPESVTLSAGRQRNLIFTIVGKPPYIHSEKNPQLLNVFSKDTKSSGFLFVAHNRRIDLKLNLQPYFYYGSMGMAFRGIEDAFIPIKANNIQLFLVKRMTASQSPNYFTTSDFISFAQQSNVCPEKGYNWPVSTLLKWNTPSGKQVHGAFYRPANFNPNKKYPVIINYYEKEADGLHGFRKPELMTFDINIPWFVSRGYLVLLADIHYKTAQPGESAFECINSAADMLETLPYVDKRKIGIEGHSFGGYETNFVVTKTTRFAAAVSAAGISDLVGFYGDYPPIFRLSFQGMVENQQFRMAGSLWDRKEDYLRNSPILNADKISTPLLLMHNFRDGSVPFREGEALFSALRKCKKDAWLLQYDNSGHTVYDPTESLDYTMRITQFFDHYLKNELMPEWMKSTGEPQLKRFLE